MILDTSTDLFVTQVPIVVIIVLSLSLLLLSLEISYNAKGILATSGAIMLGLAVVLCFVSGMPIIETILLLVIYIIILMWLLEGYNTKKSLSKYNPLNNDATKTQTKEILPITTNPDVKKNTLICSEPIANPTANATIDKKSEVDHVI